jgi:hypothetical protein
MPSWKKVITSGSDAILNSVIATGSLNTIERELIYNDQTVLDWDLHQLAADGVVSVEWDDRQLLTNSAGLSIDWQNFGLYNHQANLTVNYDEGILYDTVTSESVLWYGRQLLNELGTASFSWSGSNIVVSVPIVATGSASFIGTASYALTASYANTAQVSISSSISYLTNPGTYPLVYTLGTGNQPLGISPYGALYNTSTNAISNLGSITASNFVGTASFAIQAISSSYALTASYVPGVTAPTLQTVTNNGSTTTNNITITGSLIVSSSIGINTNTAELFDSNGVSIDWANRWLLYDNGNPAVYWNSGQLVTTGDEVTVDWLERYLRDNAGIEAVNWEHKSLKVQNGVVTTTSINWASRSLYDVTDKAVLYWSGSDQLILSASNLYAKGITTGSTSNVLTYNPTTGQVYYTASAALGGGGGPESDPIFTAWSGSNISYFAGTASFAQTASFVTNAQTASFVTSSNVFGPYGKNSVISASYAVTASYIANVSAGGNDTEIQFNRNGILTGPPPFFWCISDPGYNKSSLCIILYLVPNMLSLAFSIIEVPNVPFRGSLLNSFATNL